MKRFYKQVSIEDGAVLLDGRPVKTPMRAALRLPNIKMADAVAQEWCDQGEEVDPRSMPFTGLANAAIDRADDAMAIALAQYAETELLCYRAENPPDLVKRQAETWDPLLQWAQDHYLASFKLVSGIMHQPQPVPTLVRMKEAMLALDRFQLAAMNPIVTISGSLVLSLAVLQHHLTPEAAFDAAHLDELWQAEQWGEDELALNTRAAHRRDFLNACAFLNLCRDLG